MNALSFLDKAIFSVFFMILLNLAAFSSLAAAAEDQDIVKESKEAAEAIRQYSVEQKDAAVKQAGELLDNLDERIALWEKELKENWDDLQQAGGEKYDQTLKSLREERQKLAGWYDSMKHSSKDAWDEVKEGFSEAYTSFVRSWKKSEQEIETEKKSTAT